MTKQDMKKLISLSILMLFLSGCTGIVPGIGYIIHDQRYKDFIGKKYEVIAPLKIMKFTYFGGEYFLARAQRKENRDEKNVVDVPVGAVIIADHVSRVEHLQFETSYSYIGKIQTPGIFNGGFRLDSLMEWQPRGPSKKGSKKKEENFTYDFVGMDAKYLKEVP